MSDPPSKAESASPLEAEERALGRRLAITSHPAGMTFWMVFTEHLPTLLLVSLGASEFQIGLQRAFLPGLQVLQLPTLRTIAFVSKRKILIAGQVFAQVAGIPLLLLHTLGHLDPSQARVVALLSLAGISVGLNVGNTVWFALLRSYVEPERIGKFFGLLRSAWHLALIVYYIGAHFWLERHPGEFAPLLVCAWMLGVLRIGLIARLPERSERTGAKIRVREALALVRDDPRLRRYLIGVASNGALRSSVIPFAIVMMRREVGFSESQVIVATLAYYFGGLVSLYLWGRVADGIGPAPVFRITSIAMACLLLLLVFVDSPGALSYALVLVFFVGFSIFTSGFGVADTQVLFSLAPPDAPARTLVISGVLSSMVIAIVPIAVGLVLGGLLSQSALRLEVYHAFFALAAVLQALVFLPLRGFRRARK